MGAMGALAHAILKNRLLEPQFLPFGHFSTACKNCGKNLTNTQHPQYSNAK